jgi:hypothetical protein
MSPRTVSGIVHLSVENVQDAQSILYEPTFSDWSPLVV